VIAPIVLDAGALIAVERGKDKARALFKKARDQGRNIFIPATALAQALRPGPKAARLFQLLRQPDVEVTTVFDLPMAIEVAKLLAATKTHDVVDAHVALEAIEREALLVTTDESDMDRLVGERAAVARV
jgi:predicted nucleic acid-binding protein